MINNEISLTYKPNSFDGEVIEQMQLRHITGVKGAVVESDKDEEFDVIHIGNDFRCHKSLPKWMSESVNYMDLHYVLERAINEYFMKLIKEGK